MHTTTGYVGAVTLLSRGCDLDIRSASGGTPLHCAALNGRAKVAKQLLLLGANPNAVDHRGCTPLIIAAYSETPQVAEVVKLLLGWGAMPQMVDDSGRTAAEVLCQRPNAKSCPASAAALAALVHWPNVPNMIKTKDTPTHDEAGDLFPITQLDTAAEVEAFAKSLSANKFSPRAGKLDLAGSHLTNDSAACLGRALRACDTVTELVLADVLRSPELAVQLCLGLEQNVSIARLDLSGSDSIGERGMKAIGQLLST
jgi:ankyrin repeat protein